MVSKFFHRELLLAASLNFICATEQLKAEDATWAGGVSGSVDNATNWSTMTAPTGATSTGTFGSSSRLALTSGGNAWGTWLFNSGAGAYTLANNGSTVFSGSGFVINGGSLTVTATAPLQFLNAASAGTSAIATSAALDFLNTSTAGAANITYNSGTSSFQNSATAGTSHLNIGSAATLNFQGASSAENAAISNAGTLQFQGTSTGANAAIVNTGAGVTNFSSSAGPLGNNKLAVGSLAGAGTFDLGANELTTGGNGQSTSISGVISGSGGSLVKTGNGTMTLSGVNTYTGATKVNAGTLSVNGSIASSGSVLVASGATLQGTGTVKNVTVSSGGRLRAGDGTPASALSVTGGLTLQSGSLYAVNINPSTASATNVSGTATLGGASVEANFANASYISKRYTILTANSVAGAFASAPVTTSLPAGFRSTVTNDATHAYLNLTLNFTPPGVSLSGNQAAVSNAITGYFNRTGRIPAAYTALTPNGLSQASGQPAATAVQTSGMPANSFMGAMLGQGTGRVVGGGVGPTAYASEDDEALGYAAEKRRDAGPFTGSISFQNPLTFQSRWSVWASGFGGTEMTTGSISAGTNTTNSTVGGGSVGASYRVAPDTVAGFALSGGGSNFSTDNLGTGRSDIFQIGAFGRRDYGAAYLSGALSYGWQNVTTDRFVTVAGTDHLQANFNTNTISGRAESGYRFATPTLAVTPYAALQVSDIMLPSYRENAVFGANTFALNYLAKDTIVVRTELGARFDRSYALQTALLSLSGRLAWAHDEGNNRSVSASFASLPGTNFTVTGAIPSQDLALVSAGAEIKWLNNVSLAGTFEGEFSGRTTGYGGKGTVRYEW